MRTGISDVSLPRSSNNSYEVLPESDVGPLDIAIRGLVSVRKVNPAIFLAVYYGEEME